MIRVGQTFRRSIQKLISAGRWQGDADETALLNKCMTSGSCTMPFASFQALATAFNVPVCELLILSGLHDCPTKTESPPLEDRITKIAQWLRDQPDDGLLDIIERIAEGEGYTPTSKPQSQVRVPMFVFNRDIYGARHRLN